MVGGYTEVSSAEWSLLSPKSLRVTITTSATGGVGSIHTALHEQRIQDFEVEIMDIVNDFGLLPGLSSEEDTPIGSFIVHCRLIGDVADFDGEAFSTAVSTKLGGYVKVMSTAMSLLSTIGMRVTLEAEVCSASQVLEALHQRHMMGFEIEVIDVAQAIPPHRHSEGIQQRDAPTAPPEALPASALVTSPTCSWCLVDTTLHYVGQVTPIGPLQASMVKCRLFGAVDIFDEATSIRMLLPLTLTLTLALT